MSKTVYLILIGGLVLVTIAAVNINIAKAHPQIDFVQISVLAKSQANYRPDENPIPIPPVSMDIVEDKVHDLQETSAVRVIIYTTLPARDTSSTGPNDADPWFMDYGNPVDDQASTSEDGTLPATEDSTDKDKTDKDKDKTDKDKDKTDKDKEKDTSTNPSDVEESKPDKVK